MKRTMQQNRQHDGFTLIELLIVISIIALLISLLLPSLKAARDAAKVVQCSSNMRQFRAGYSAYVLDYDGWLPVWYGWRTKTWPYIYGSSKTYWPRMTGDGRLEPNVYLCPEGVGQLDLQANNGRNNVTYIQGFNKRQDVGWVSQILPERAIFAPGKAISNFCSWYNNNRPNQSSIPSIIYPNTHRAGRPVLYYDGHVEVHNEWADVVPIYPTSHFGIPWTTGDEKSPCLRGWDASQISHAP